MSRDKTSGMTPRNRTLVTAAEWFAGGQRVWYDPEYARVRTRSQAAAAPAALRVFERIAGTGRGADEDAVWLTMLPGFPDGSYGWAQVDRMLGDDLVPRLYVEPVGQGDSDKPGITGTPPSNVLTWSRRCGGTTACAAPSLSTSTTPHWRCLSCCAAKPNSPPPAASPGQ